MDRIDELPIANIQPTGIHGFLIGNATIFNSPIAYGCSWNMDVRLTLCGDGLSF